MSALPLPEEPQALVIGGGPAGLMAAEQLLAQGVEVDLCDAMPSVGRKFLLAGKGGLNLTHAEPLERLLTRYGMAMPQLAQGIGAFGPDALRAWAAALGVQTFVGSSMRVFPRDMKAAPLLRAWLHRLRGQGLRLHMRHRWVGFGEGDSLRLDTPQGARRVRPRVTVLALGGGSWARLGSDGAWWPWLAERGVALAPLVPSNCGFDIGWSDHLRARFAGAPLKGVVLSFGSFRQHGEMVITAGGVEGSLVYAASAALRDAIAHEGSATLTLDLLPALPADRVQRELTHPRGSRSLSSHLKSRLGLEGAKAALLWEVAPKGASPEALAALVKALPLTARAPRPIDEAISSAGGVRLDAINEHGMLTALPGVFCAGEMLDWEAPTGGYLLTACFSTGRLAGLGAARWVQGAR
jgi:uncharacterized flavoprotein (TIGR03862 family)